MIFLSIFLLSLVQGFAEFLPISSSGHLVLLHQLVALPGVDTLSFDIALHWGTLLALVIAFWPDILHLLAGWWRSLRTRSVQENPDGRLAWLLILGTIPAVIVGEIITMTVGEDSIRQPWVVVAALAVGGIVLLFADRFGRHDRTIQDVTVRDALLIGTFQTLAFIPGISRSGATIITALLLSLKREAAVRFAFLLSIPVILLAGIKQLLDLAGSHPPSGAIKAMTLGAVLTAIIGYFVIRWFLRFVNRHTLAAFAYYRFAVAIVAAAWLLLRS